MTAPALLSTLPPERAADADFEAIQALVRAEEKTLVVLDDDPTGTQTVHGVTVLTEWSVATLAAELARRETCFFILTNTRALPHANAVAVNQEIARHLTAAAQRSGRDFSLVSRSDSTLRGHFPGETDTLAEALEHKFDGLVLMPAFPEGGRVTIHGIHYVTNRGELVPVGETEFARDSTFGFSHSDLKRWVEEKTGGRIRAADVVHVPLETLRESNAAVAVCALFTQIPRGRIIVVDAVTYGDIAAFVHGLLLAESTGRCYLARTAASYVRVRAAISPRARLSAVELGLASGRGQPGGLIVVGSYVDRTTRQLQPALGLPNLDAVEVNVDRLFDPATCDAEIARIAGAAEAALSGGRHALVYTSRAATSVRGRAGELPIAASVSAALVAIVRQIPTRPRFIVAKGGITSSDLATRALGVRRARVLGQITAGVSVWALGNESRYPGMAYVVFPGNVGEVDALRDVIAMLA